ncbi:MAG TPA: glucose-1-phosphate adenylyltransferase [Pirellulales bacterium]|jgi:glucose-1-phosphate adenylyltransferase|nr:glucose-1-phosphate adenylyltransferase [Pirellulales bacterium]
MRNILTLVLGGGRGTRLYPLTKYRSKPAVPLAGKYRLIDIPLSNCINSGLNRVYVLTQFNSVSLHRHIRRTYIFDAYSGGFVEILAAQQTLDNEGWYQGTADAVRQHIRYLQQPGIDYVLILSGDQLYRMNYEHMLETHKSSNADVTIAAMPVARKDAAALGIMKLDDSGRVVGFLEKPKTDEEIQHVQMSPEWIERRGVQSKGRDLMASMGIYLFARDALIDVLTKTDYRDFGKEIFPASIRTRHVQMHLFDGYWEDIGTIKSFYQCNLDLAASNPPFELASALEPIYTRARFLAPSRIESATIRNSLVSDGCVIGNGAVIENSVIGLRCKIGQGVTIRNSIIMGADEYESHRTAKDASGNHKVPWGIGDGSFIEGAIVDKNCRIGRNVRVVNEHGVDSSEESPEHMIADGVVVVQKDASLPDGWRIR